METTEKVICINLLTATTRKDKQSLIKMWNSSLHRFTQEVQLIDAYTYYLIRHDESDKVIPLIESVLKKQ